MKIAKVKIIGASPYSASKKFEKDDVPMLEKEGADAYELRTWREKMTVDESGQWVIPQMAFKFALDRAAHMLGMQIPGKGKSTYKKHFVSGCLAMTDLQLGVQKDDASFIKLSVHSNGIRGSGSRVTRYFPQIGKWGGEMEFAILDETITEKVFTEHLTAAGQFVGVGRFRPENGGFNGRFSIGEVRWS